MSDADIINDLAILLRRASRINEEIIWVPAGLAVAAMCIGGFIAAYDGVTQTAKAALAPKVLILETVANLAGHK